MQRPVWRRPIPILLAFGLFLAAALGRAATGSGAEETRRPQVDLAWFMAGLRDLCRSKDARLKLTPVQAKAILPELQSLVDEGLLVVDPNKLETSRQGFASGQGQGLAGGLSEEDRRKIQERRRQQAEKIEKAIERMEKVLRQAQSDYILNIEFDPGLYGLEFTRPGGTGSFSQADFEKLRKTMEEGRRRLVQLNKETLELLKKLAK